MSTKSIKNRKHLARLFDLGCIICKKLGFPNSPPQIHHIKYKDLGISRKSSDFEAIPLCYEHHMGKEGYHYSPKKFNAKWGTQKELLREVLSYVNNTDDVR